jgi:hypothetical protein
MTETIRILGGGPAGSAAAISALAEGRAVEVFEPGAFPRHKVCGEFLSPGIGPLLEQLGVWPAFLAARPARIERMVLHFGTREKRANLSERAFGFSRYALDSLLAAHAVTSGAAIRREKGVPGGSGILATGRSGAASPRGHRLFGFKAHFTGPVDDAVELFFFNGCYAGVSAVENGVTNVCALALERVLSAHGFDFDSVLQLCQPLAQRVRPLTRAMKWLATGPLSFTHRLDARLSGATYPAGDALGFVDPFTGSGILAALMTGRMAGIAAARGVPSGEYLSECRRRLIRQYHVAALFRAALAAGCAGLLASAIPAQWLFHFTRPALEPRQASGAALPISTK